MALQLQNGSLERYQLNVAFHQSIIDADIVRMRNLLSNSHVNVNFIQNEEWTGLYLAILHKHYRIVKALLNQYNADVNLVIPIEKKTVIHTVCKCDDVQALEILIEHNVDCMATDECNVTALHICAEFNSTETCTMLLNYDTTINVNAEDADGYTPLHYACAEGHLEIVRKICEQKTCKFDLVNIENRTALHLACFSCKSDIVALIIDRGANVNTIDIYGNSPIMTACDLNQHQMFDMLKNVNAFIDYRNLTYINYMKNRCVSTTTTTTQSDKFL